ncbi:hypothetical protein [Paenibacillus sonchi]|uniref:hypothetical protein n=1 Tax=Paenibacillus sonchi TaxID=373687 RepID=UPI000317381C|nr:hypothetical protein [Paenibacillus sonchi]
MLAPLLPTTVIAPSGEATAYLYDENGLLVGLEQGDRRYYMITDAVGTPQLVVGLDGAIVKELQYDGFGVKLLDTSPDFSVVAIGFGASAYAAAGGRRPNVLHLRRNVRLRRLALEWKPERS